MTVLLQGRLCRHLGAGELPHGPALQPATRRSPLVRLTQRGAASAATARRTLAAADVMPDADDPELLVTCASEERRAELQSRLTEATISLDGGAVAVPRFDPDHVSARPLFDAAACQRQLGRAAELGGTLLTAAQLPSTQTLLQNNARLFPSGTVCVADTQHQGKGRGGNTWSSPPGCLMFSLLTRLDILGTRLPFIQYVVSLAILEAVQTEAGKLLGRNGGSLLDVRIKWPNDLYSGRHKLGGVLCQTVYRERQFQVVVGVGLNVGNEEPSTCIDALLRAEQQRRGGSSSSRLAFGKEALLAAILSLLERHVRTLQADGFGPLEAAYTGNWLHTGQQVTLKGEDGEADVSARIQGLTPDGYLLAVDEAGERYSLSPDGNSLDFFHGLIKAKLPAAGAAAQ